jgi:hypothetical protein
MEPALVNKLYEQPPPGQRELYVSLFDRPVHLRPQVELRGYVSMSLLERARSLEPDGVVPIADSSSQGTRSSSE